MKVILLPEVLEYLEDLSVILYEKGYFSIEKTALKYVLELYDDIASNLSEKRHRPAPGHYEKYGRGIYYASFKKSKRTTWYVFFTKHNLNAEIICLIRYIGNNHTEAHHLHRQ